MQNKNSIFIAILAIFFTVGSLWYTNRTVTPRQATWEDVLIEGKNGGYSIIQTDELASLYRKNTINSLFLVDTRQKWEYRTGHLKSAENFPMEPTSWARWKKASTLEKFLGPDKNRTIVFY